MNSKSWRAVEFVLVCIALPAIIAWQGTFMRRWVIPQILVLAALALVALWRDRRFDLRSLRLLPAEWRASLRRIGIVWILGGIVLLALSLAFAPLAAFALPRSHPVAWVAVLVFFPLISALPQELVFRAFVYHRYGALFGDPRLLALVSAFVFAIAHLEFGNAVAPVLSFAGGLLFSYTFARTRSLALVALEHGLWGDWIFTIGLGPYFYGGGL